MKYVRERKSWDAMKKRCQNPEHPKYARYGGRGISFDARWLSFAAFIADMGPCPDGYQLERIDNDSHYFKANCRWASRKEQARNKSNNTLTAQMVTCIKEARLASDLNERQLAKSNLALYLV